ncbi:MAG: PAS domain S-box protein [Bryobacteraceae bacterium]
MSPESYYRLIVEGNNKYALTFLDLDGVIRTWNAGAKVIHGYPPEDAIGQHVRLLYSSADRESLVPETELDLARREGVADDTRWLVGKDGVEFWAEGLTTAVRNHVGEIVGFSKVVRDASERRRLKRSWNGPTKS